MKYKETWQDVKGGDSMERVYRIEFTADEEALAHAVFDLIRALDERMKAHIQERTGA